MPRVVLVYPLNDDASETLLRQRTDVVEPRSDRPDDIRAALEDADAVILRGPARLSASELRASTRLRVIAGLGAGTDHIAVDTATELGIPVLSGAGVGASAVAEYVVAAAIMAHRNIRPFDEALRQGSFQWSDRATALGTQLRGTTVGIVGYGHIGQAVGRVMHRAFDAEVLVHTRTPTSSEVPVEFVATLDELLSRSQTLTLHVPRTPETTNLIGHRELRLLGPDGVLVNASRGGVVDERALVNALSSGELKAAVTDVFESEPPGPDDVAALAAVPGLTMTPHIAGVTEQAVRGLSLNAVQGVLDVLESRRPANVVNPAVFDDDTAGQRVSS